MLVEMDEKSGDGVRGIQATEGVLLADDFLAGVADGLGHAGFEETGEDDIHADACGADFAGERLREANQPCFRGGVGGLADRRMDGGVAGNEDEVAGAAADHRLEGRLGAAEGTVQVDFELAIPVGFADAGEQLVVAEPGIGDEQLEGLQCFKKSADGVGLGDIEIGTARSVDGEATVTQRRSDPVSQIAVTAGDEHVFHVAGACRAWRHVQGWSVR